MKRTILDVPFLEKDQVKALGAWWDPDIRKWFVPESKPTAPFVRWLPKARQNAQDTDKS